jgi:hypothetical protein
LGLHSFEKAAGGVSAFQSESGIGQNMECGETKECGEKAPNVITSRQKVLQYKEMVQKKTRGESAEVSQ